MNTTFGSEGLKRLISYPFQDPKAGTKLLVASLLILASYIIPLIPFIFFAGYIYEIYRRTIARESLLPLPEWDNWGRLFSDGLKLFGVSFIYLLPVMAIFGCGFATYFGSFFAMIPLADAAGDELSFLIFIPMLVLFTSMAIGMLLSLLTSLVLPVAIGNMIARDSFGAAFRFGEMWRVFKANVGGYIVAFLIVLAFSFVAQMGGQILMYTIILCVIFPFFMSFVYAYLGLISAALYGEIYRDAAAKQAGSAQGPAITPSELPAV